MNGIGRFRNKESSGFGFRQTLRKARRTTKEFLQFLPHAPGSLAEVETLLILSVELGFANADGVTPGLKEIDELQKMIVALKRKLDGGSPLAACHSPIVPECR